MCNKWMSWASYIALCGITVISTVVIAASIYNMIVDDFSWSSDLAFGASIALSACSVTSFFSVKKLSKAQALKDMKSAESLRFESDNDLRGSISSLESLSLNSI